MNLCTSCLLLTIQIKSIHIKSHKESDNQVSDLEDDKTGFKKYVDLLLDQILTVPDTMLSIYSQNDTSSNGISKNLVLNTTAGWQSVRDCQTMDKF